MFGMTVDPIRPVLQIARKSKRVCNGLTIGTAALDQGHKSIDGKEQSIDNVNFQTSFCHSQKIVVTY